MHLTNSSFKQNDQTVNLSSSSRAPAKSVGKALEFPARPPPPAPPDSPGSGPWRSPRPPAPLRSRDAG